MNYLVKRPVVPARNYRLAWQSAGDLLALSFASAISVIRPCRKRLTWAIIFLLGPGLAALQAQDAVPAAGGDASGSGGSVSYSVGQVAYTTNSNDMIIQGVQQPYEISTITGLEEAPGIALLVSVYPNPTTHLLTLKTGSGETGHLSYHLFDIHGKLLKYRKITSSLTDIAMDDLVSATYLLIVTEEDKAVKIFKIIKH